MFSGDLFSVLDESTSSKEEKNAEKLTENVKRFIFKYFAITVTVTT